MLKAGSGVSTVPVPADLASKTAMAQTAKKLALSLDGFNEGGMLGDKEQKATSFCLISDSSRWGKARYISLYSISALSVVHPRGFEPLTSAFGGNAPYKYNNKNN